MSNDTNKSPVFENSLDPVEQFLRADPRQPEEWENAWWAAYGELHGGETSQNEDASS